MRQQYIARRGADSLIEIDDAPICGKRAGTCPYIKSSSSTAKQDPLTVFNHCRRVLK
jgi:hypothetical protein